MISIVAQTNDNEIINNLTVEDLEKQEFSWVWVDFEAPTDNEIALLESHFHFHPLAVEDCMHDLQRPKMDYYENHSFFVIHAVSKEDLSKREIDIFLEENRIVTFHKHSSGSINSVFSLLNRIKNKKELDEYFVFHQLLDNVVDKYFPIVYDIEDHINELEDNTNRLSMEQLLDQLFDRRGELLKLRQTVHPMRDLLYRVLNTHHLEGIHERREYFVDIHDHLIKVADMIASNREMTQDIRDSYLSLNSHQTNKTMQVLTVISVIFMPLTFIVGVYGMNFTYMPELDAKYGYFIVWIIMIAVSVSMFFWFKKKGWFD
ncbi:magnesium/cobalt transporter CorA [Virgibacillus siamensis]|uniref:magnesium/cobalt transporter CorA n=1 Tax=Virgibacillus siamensis TaxID=480071 RepID=UPI000985133F|nr:magnesium/cobalt transporter CorA [Virgibacillus siamensis]